MSDQLNAIDTLENLGKQTESEIMTVKENLLKYDSDTLATGVSDALNNIITGNVESSLEGNSKIVSSTVSRIVTNLMNMGALAMAVEMASNNNNHKGDKNE